MPCVESSKYWTACKALSVATAIVEATSVLAWSVDRDRDRPWRSMKVKEKKWKNMKKMLGTWRITVELIPPCHSCRHRSHCCRDTSQLSTSLDCYSRSDMDASWPWRQTLNGHADMRPTVLVLFLLSWMCIPKAKMESIDMVCKESSRLVD